MNTQNSASSSISGMQSATVLDNKDPDQKGRIRVALHSDTDSVGTSWARVVQSIAGNNYGGYFLPEIGDEVLVGFEMNNPNNPIVLGVLYNGKNKQTTSYDADNYIKNLKTKAGNEINFNDKPGEETVLIVNKTAGDNQILLTLKNNGQITIQSKGKIELTAPEIDLNANKTFNIKGGEVNISGSKITLKADSDVAITGQGKVTATGTTGVELSASAGDIKMSGLNVSGTAEIGVTMKGNATAEISASGMTTVKGGIVMIN